jgi:hypothetical protein
VIGVQREKKESRFDRGRETLKWMALITMTIDHIGAILYPENSVLRMIGRLSFPLFCYLLVLGLESTRNVKRYFARLFIFALISQVPFYLAFELEPFESLNIFFTLSSGLIFIYSSKKRNILMALLPLFASVVLNFDYGIYGIMSIGCMQLLMKDTELGVFSFLVLNLVFLPVWHTQFLSLFALPFIFLQKRWNTVNTDRKVDAKTGYPWWKKYFFYVYYPLHLTILYFVKVWFLAN